MVNGGLAGVGGCLQGILAREIGQLHIQFREFGLGGDELLFGFLQR